MLMFASVLIKKIYNIMKRTVNTSLNAIKVFLFVSVFSTATMQAQDLAMAKTVAIIDFETEVINYGTIA